MYGETPQKNSSRKIDLMNKEKRRREINEEEN